jgi:hypothetical protein
MDEKAGVRLETEQSEAPVERLLPAPPSDSPSAVVALIGRMALNAHADAKKLERVIAMYERLNAKEAELAYNAAKGRILKKLAGIKTLEEIIDLGHPLARPAREDRLGLFSISVLRACVLIDRDRGTPRGAAPPTPPGIRVRTTAVRSG